MGIWFEIIVTASLLLIIPILLSIAVDLHQLANYVKYQLTNELFIMNENVTKQFFKPRK